MTALELAKEFGIATYESATVSLEIDGCINIAIGNATWRAHPLRGTHITGSELTGRLKISAEAPVPYRTITVTLRGEAKVKRFEYSREGGGTWRSETTEFLKDTFILKESLTSGKSDELDKGLHNFPFQFQISKENLPISQSTYRVEVQYSLEAHLHKGFPVARVKVPYAGAVDVTSENLAQSVTVVKDKKVLFTSQAIHLAAELGRSGIRRGEMLKLRVKIENSSGRSLRLKAAIKQKQDYTIRHYYCKQVLIPAETVSKDTREENVAPHTSADWEPEGLIVPQTEPTSMDLSKIQVTYSVRVRASVPLGTDCIIDIPVTVV